MERRMLGVKRVDGPPRSAPRIADDGEKTAK